MLEFLFRYVNTFSKKMICQIIYCVPIKGGLSIEKQMFEKSQEFENMIFKHI